MKHYGVGEVVILLVIIGVVVFFIYAYEQNQEELVDASIDTPEVTVTKSPTVTTTKPRPTKTVTVDVNTMIADYDSNQLAASNKYSGQILQFTAFVDNISKNTFNEQPYVVLVPSQEDHYFGTDIKCGMTESNALKLVNGQQVTIKGESQGMDFGIIVMENCVPLL